MRRIAAPIALLLLAACQTTDGPRPAMAPIAPVAQAPRLEPVPSEWESLARANLRSGPGTDSPVVARVIPGDRLAVLGRVPGTEWLAVDRRGETVFIRQDLARALPSASVAPRCRRSRRSPPRHPWRPRRPPPTPLPCPRGSRPRWRRSRPRPARGWRRACPSRCILGSGATDPPEAAP